MNADLPKKVLLFSQILRKKKVGVTIDNVVDVLKGISFIDIRERRDFYHLLKFNFVSHREQMGLFDELFEQFWSSEKEMEVPAGIGDEEKEAIQERGDGLSFEDRKNPFLTRDWGEELGREGSKEQGDVAAYSPAEILAEKDFGHLQKEELEKVKEFVLALSQQLARTLSRRWKSGKRGKRIDLRRSMRHSMRYGGEIVELRRKHPKSKPVRLLFFCDVSGSMDVYSQFALLFMYGVQNAYPHCETFVFSTRLSHVTSLLKRKAFKDALSLLSRKVLDWSGGTNIGAALHQLHQRHSGLLSPGRTLFLLLSDGWDRGDSELLDSEMKSLKKQVKRLIWLNPLLGSSQYRPLCKGMSTALPHLDYFLPCHNFLSLKTIGHLMMKI